MQKAMTQTYAMTFTSTLTQKYVSYTPYFIYWLKACNCEPLVQIQHLAGNNRQDIKEDSLLGPADLICMICSLMETQASHVSCIWNALRRLKEGLTQNRAAQTMTVVRTAVKMKISLYIQIAWMLQLQKETI